MKLFLAPHCDDETLFGAFTIMREQPRVVIVTGDEQRQAESVRAIHKMLHAFDYAPPPFLLRLDETASRLWDDARLILSALPANLVFAPAIEDGGHEHHNRLGVIADELWPGKVIHYLTYTNRGKSTNGTLVPAEPWMIELKLQALACYRSQIQREATRPHFLRGIEEYYAA